MKFQRIFCYLIPLLVISSLLMACKLLPEWEKGQIETVKPNDIYISYIHG